MSTKKPAHIVIVEMIEESIQAYVNSDNQIQIMLLMGMLSAETEILKRIIVSKERRKEIVKSLQRIKKEYPSEFTEKLFSESFFQSILVDVE